MTLNFPNNPVDGDTWTDGNGVEWKFKGHGWKEIKAPTLLSMSDVSSAAPDIDDRLRWDGDQWASDASASSLALTDLSDIQGIPVKDDYLIHDGTNFQMASSNSDPVVFGKMETTDGRLISEFLVNSVWFYLYYAKVTYDTHGMFDLGVDPTRLTIPVAGIYRINTTCLTKTNWSSVSSRDQYLNLKPYNISNTLLANYNDRCNQLRYYVNGYCVTNWSVVRKCNVGDYFKTYARHVGSSATYVNATNISMSALKLADLP